MLEQAVQLGGASGVIAHPRTVGAAHGRAPRTVMARRARWIARGLAAGGPCSAFGGIGRARVASRVGRCGALSRSGRSRGGRACRTPLRSESQPTPGISQGLTRGSAPSTPKRSRADARKIAGDGFAAMADRRFASRRRTATAANGDDVPEAALALRRADIGAGTQGSKGERSPSLARPRRSTSRGPA